MPRSIAANPSLSDHDRIVHALTAYDRRQSANPRAHHNPYFLGIVLGALERSEERIALDIRSRIFDITRARLTAFVLRECGLPKMTETEEYRQR